MVVGTAWWWLGANVFFSGPWFPVFQIVMVLWDHRRHRDWRSTLLAFVWPLLCVSMIYVLQGRMDPPLFGIPLALLFSLVWWQDFRVFMAGVVLYYALSGVVLTAAVLEGSPVHWPFLTLWPMSFALLVLWRNFRMRAVFMAAHANGYAQSPDSRRGFAP